jgi:hypothetical protein
MSAISSRFKITGALQILQSLSQFYKDSFDSVENKVNQNNKKTPSLYLRKWGLLFFYQHSLGKKLPIRKLNHFTIKLVPFY